MDEFDVCYKTYGKRRSLRMPDWDYRLPAVYHVTMTTYFRGRWFVSPAFAGAFVDALREQVAFTHYRIYAFCVMPDHVHILCQPDMHHPVGLEEFVQRVKGTATRHLHWLGAEGTIWQPDFLTTFCAGMKIFFP